MITTQRIEKFYRDIAGLTIKFPVSAISKATGYSKGNVSEYINRKKEPSESFLNAFYEKFYNVEKTSIVEEDQPDYKDKYIESLERENKRLQKDLDISLGELRHNALLARSVAETNQDLLIEILSKQRRASIDEVSLSVGRANVERYKKLKEEGRFDGVRS